MSNVDAKKNKQGQSQYTGLEIAVIGMAGRFPGANTPGEFWENLKNGVDAIRFFSDEELIAAGVDQTLLDNPNYVKAGRFVKDKEFFDSSFFGYIPDEAQVMDPNIRMMHQCTWEALESAGYDPSRYDGFIGLFAGAGSSFNWEAYTMLAGLGNTAGAFASIQLRARDFVSTLISYRLNLKGPAVFVHTACSTSLVAIHMACRSLLTGESHIALAGGVTLKHLTISGSLYQEGMISSPDGYCRTFDARAGGTAGGEGAGVVVLKRLKNAMADGDNILAIIKGSAMNNDGLRKVGYSAPSVDGQAEVIRMALKMARVEPRSISYVEAHGTATKLGDPIEVDALINAFGKSVEKYCGLGSVKTNVGHMDTAAGVTGVIKTVMALQHRKLPPSLHFESPNPDINFADSPFYVVDKFQEWRNPSYPLRAGVSAFGIGGTNAHLILEEAPPVPPSITGRESQLLLFSAKSPAALERMTDNLRDFFMTNPGIDIADAAYTLQFGRQAFQYRRMLVCKSIGEAANILSDSKSTAIKTFQSPKEKRKIIFMFSGQGTQYVDMGVELYRKETVFREETDRCFKILEPVLGYNLRCVLYPQPGDDRDRASDMIAKTSVTQPVLFIFEYALARLLMHWGIEPDGMTGYSYGEYVAACLAGVLPLEDALKLVAVRGKLMENLPEGAMLSIPLPEKELLPLLNDRVSLAVDNGPSCIVAGAEEDIAAFEKEMKQHRLMCMRVGVSHAGHSRLMDPILKEFQSHVAKVPLSKPQIPYISNVTGTWMVPAEAANPAYWPRHLRSTVRFAAGVNELVKDKTNVFIEIGPGKALSNFIRQHPDREPGQLVVNLVRDEKEPGADQAYLLDRIGRLWLNGVTCGTGFFATEEKRRRVLLPTYPFEKIPYPVEADVLRLISQMMAAAGGMPTATPMQTGTETAGPVPVVNMERPHLATAYVAPETPTEGILAQMWGAFFGIGNVGVTDDFFELGGDSLKAMTLAAQLHQRFNVDVQLADFFAGSSIRELAARIDSAVKKDFHVIPAVEKREYYPMSPAQKRLFILQQMDAENTVYNEPRIFPLPMAINKQHLEETFRKMIARHESFRTSFEIRIDEPVQIIYPVDKVAFEIAYYDQSILDESSGAVPGDDGLSNLIAHFVQPFDLSRPPLMRVGLIKRGEADYVLVLDSHHTIVDGLSMSVFIEEFLELYNGASLQPLRIQYKDFAQWQTGQWISDTMAAQATYWRERFSGDIPVLDIPIDFPRPKVQSFEGAQVEYDILPSLANALNAYAAEKGMTLFMVFLGAFYILLSKLSGQEDIVIGTILAGRRHADLERIIGMFVNTLALRVFPIYHQDVDGFMAELKKTILDAFENQEYPFEELVEIVSPPKDTGRNPLFDVLFTFHNPKNPVRGEEVAKDETEAEDDGMNDTESGGVNFTAGLDGGTGYKHGVAKFDISLTGISTGRDMGFSVEYCTRLFKRSTIDRFIAYLKRIMIQMTAKETDSSKKTLGDIEILSPGEREHILLMANGAHEPFDVNETIHNMFEMQVDKTPERTALSAAGITGTTSSSHIKSTSYRELNNKSNQLARLLRKKGVTTDSFVGLMVERSPEMIIGMVAILKSGGAYVPIDSQYPAERKKYMLEDSGVKLLLVNEDFCYDITGTPDIPAADFLPDGVETIDLRDENFFNGSIENPDPLPLPSDSPLGESLLYMIYTSGSTGKPKGVMLEHRNLVNLMKYQYTHTGIDFSKVLQFTTISFDVSFQEIFSTLLAGGELHLIDKDLRNDVQGLFRLVAEQQIKTLYFPASYLKYILSEEAYMSMIPGSVDHIVTAGEQVIVTERFRSFLRDHNVWLHNHYGPSEAHVVTASAMDPAGELPELPDIGKPVSNTSIFILDKKKKLQPIGVPGELYICGIQVGRGYWNNPKLTGQCFQFNGTDESICCHPPHESDRSRRSYKTGDLARLLPNGNIQFLGRIDHQVKIRGFRVELGEIENRLLGHESVKDAVVLARVDDGSDKYLCAYVVAASPVPTIEELHEYLEADLPDYMVPDHFVFLEVLPLTPNRKIDRRALPAPKVTVDEEYIAPANAVEKTLVGIWAEVLNISQEVVSVKANFFRMGGHSLKAAILIARIHKTFDVKLPLTEVFQRPTVRGLAHIIDAAAVDAFMALQLAEKREYYPVSPAQGRMYIMWKMDPENTGYNMPMVVPLKMTVDGDALKSVFIEMIARHESYRTSFYVLGETTVQRIHEPGDTPFEIEYFDIGEVAARENLESLVGKFIRPFRLDRAPLLRVGLIQVSELEYIFLMDMHHIVTDGVSQQIFVKELIALLQGVPLEPAIFQYKDYSQWQNSESVRESLEKKGEYWVNRFSDDIPVLNLPTDYTRPPVQHFDGAWYKLSLDRDATSALKTLALEADATLYMILLAVFTVLLSKLSCSEDVIVGTPVANRNHADLQGITGMFVNTLALRNHPTSDKRFQEYLGEVRYDTMQAFDNQDYPFENLVDKLTVDRNLGRNPLFDVMFSFLNFGEESGGNDSEVENEDNGESSVPFDPQKIRAKFDITLMVNEVASILQMSFEYCTRLFKDDTIRRFANYFETVVSTVIDDPRIKIGKIAIISPDERQQLLVDLNRTASDMPLDKTIYGLFMDEVEKYPHRTAVVFEDSMITYQELALMSGRLAQCLRSLGVGPDVIVGIISERCLEMTAGLIGILGAGGAYLPIDPGYPVERIRYMLADSHTQTIITSSDNWNDILHDLNVVDLHSCLSKDNEVSEPGDVQHSEAGPDDAAYIIYTSGTTGRPKGTITSHTNAIRVVKKTNYICFGKLDNVLSLSNYAFDGSVFDIYGALLNGATLVMVKSTDILSPERLSAVIKQKGVTMFFITAALFNTLVELKIDCFDSTRKIVFGGERGSVESTRKALAYLGKGRLINGYGPTETTVFATAYHINEIPEDAVSIPIGSPIANTSVYVLDAFMNPVPILVPGELYIGGHGLSRGYLNQPELTREKFVDNPFVKGEKLYRSGDLVRFLPDGNVDFIDRIDQQVKIRGFRIELGEIQALLQKHDAVSETVVTVRSNSNNDKIICAYIVYTDTENNPHDDVLRDYLAEKLPDYMIPTYYIPIDSVPKTTTGKVDRRALPEPGISPETEHKAPVTQWERRLAVLWSEVLGIDLSLIGMDSDFFRLGGHSLKATVLAAGIHKTFEVKLPLADIFRYSILKDQAAALAAAGEQTFEAIPKAETREYYPLSISQNGVYIQQQKDETGTVYNMPQIIPLVFAVDKERLENALRMLILRHDSLRTSFEMVNDVPVQRVHRDVMFTVDVMDVDPGKDLTHIFHQFIQPFDLTVAPLLRVCLLQMAEGRSILMIDTHHIISDGVSLDVFGNELIALYMGEQLPTLPVQYPDYTLWRSTGAVNESLSEQKRYWLDLFSGDLPSLNLPLDYERPPVRSFVARDVQCNIGRPLTGQLNQLKEQTDTTLFMIMTTVCNVLLSTYSVQEDIVLGSPVSGRSRADLQPLIGMFVNMLALRNFPESVKPFSKFLQEVKTGIIDAMENQDYHFEALVRDLGIQGDPGRNPLFDVVLAVQNMETGPDGEALPQLEEGVVGPDTSTGSEFSTSKFDLLLTVIEGGGNIQVFFSYSTRLFNASTIESMAGHFLEILHQVAENPDIQLKDIRMSHQLEEMETIALDDGGDFDF